MKFKETQKFEGQYLEISMLKVALFFFNFVFILFSVNGGVTELKNNTSGGQSVKIETTDRQCVNGPNHKWVKCTFLI